MDIYAYRWYILSGVLIIVFMIFIRLFAKKQPRIADLVAENECIPEELLHPEVLEELRQQGKLNEEIPSKDLIPKDARTEAEAKENEKAKSKEKGKEEAEGEETGEEQNVGYFAKQLVNKLIIDAKNISSGRKEKDTYYQNLLVEVYKKFQSLAETLPLNEKKRGDVFLKEIKNAIRNFEETEQQQGAGFFLTPVREYDLVDLINKHERLICHIYPSLK